MNKDKLKDAIKSYGDMRALYEDLSKEEKIHIMPESMEDLLEGTKVQLQYIHDIIDSLINNRE